jgi:AcrR family transcriptional regulator
MAEDNTKELIISVVMDMLGEGLQAEMLTTRGIATRAGIGVGLINYHFQTKERLIDIALGRYADKAVAMMPGIVNGSDGTPKQKLKKLSKFTAGSLAHNPSIARISILRDLSSGSPDDGIQKILKAYEPLVLQIVGDDKYWSQLIGSIFCFTFQSAFLRAGVIKETTGFDFFDDTQRDKFVEDTIETVLQNII